MTKTEYIVDALNRTVGRVASETAMKLMGKNKADYRDNICPDISVKIINASKAKISAEKMRSKKYYRHSQYPGGQKEDTIESLIKKFGYGEVFKKAVYGMLPKNKLRPRMMKNLTIID